ncbi:MAG: HAD family hydrolase [Gemmatimonadaceae bacterium]
MDVPVLLFEFEGVLADTAALREVALAAALAVDGIELTPSLARHAVGLPTEEAVRRIRHAAGTPEDGTAIELTRLRAERVFAERAGKGLNLQPGVRAALDQLSGMARCAIVTRASRREVEFILGLSGLEGMFRPVIALEDASPAKPSAAPYRAALERIGQLFPGQQLHALAVEDTVIGVHAARAAGIPSIVVGPLPAHEAVEADAWVETVAQLTPARVRELIGGPRTGRQR